MILSNEVTEWGNSGFGLKCLVDPTPVIRKACPLKWMVTAVFLAINKKITQEWTTYHLANPRASPSL